jgi:adsorption protein B
MRVPVANIIAIMAGRRAIAAYIASLFSGETKWEKTPHFSHPARVLHGEVSCVASGRSPAPDRI